MVRNAPVSVHQQLEIDISGLSHSGEGVGRYQGFTVFVPQGVPGDRLRVKIISVQKNYARGLLQSVVTTSPFRTDPPCEYYQRCGGCQLQHIQYSDQLKLKTRMVRDALTRIGSINPEVIKETRGMESPWNYRNKAQYPVRGRKGLAQAGFFSPGSHDLIQIDSCGIQSSSTQEVIDTIIKFINDHKIPPYNEKTGHGLIRHILVRESLFNGEIMVILVTNGDTIPAKQNLLNDLTKQFPRAVSIVQNINTRRDNVILGQKTKILYGKDHIIEKLRGFNFKISPGSFFQVNTRQAEVLYDIILQYSNLKGNEIILDLYCGTGSIALYLAPHSSRVYGIEVAPQAIKDAGENAHINNIYNAEFFVGKAEELMPKLMKQGIIADIVVVDPPRKGCHPDLLQSILDSVPERIIYVSCNPSTLARDLKILTENDLYHVKEVQPVDMFPHTYHVECCSLLIRQQ